MSTPTLTTATLPLSTSNDAGDLREQLTMLNAQHATELERLRTVSAVTIETLQKQLANRDESLAQYGSLLRQIQNVLNVTKKMSCESVFLCRNKTRS